MYCTFCNFQNKSDNKFCESCGKPLQTKSLNSVTSNVAGVKAGKTGFSRNWLLLLVLVVILLVSGYALWYFSDKVLQATASHDQPESITISETGLVSTQASPENTTSPTSVVITETSAEIPPTDPVVIVETSAEIPPTETRSLFSITASNAASTEKLDELDIWASQILISPDGTLLVARIDNEIQIWDLETLSYKLSLWHTHDVGDMVFSPDGKILASIEAISPIVRIWDVQSGEQLHAVEEAWGKVVFSPNSESLAVAVHQYINNSYRDGLLIWDIQSRSQRIFVTDSIISVSAFNPSGQDILLNNRQGLDLMDLQTEEIAQIYAASDNERAIQRDHDAFFNHQGDKLIAYDDHGTIRVIEIASQSILYTLNGNSPTLNPASEQFAYLASIDQYPYYTLRFVEIDTGVEQSISGEIEAVNDMIYSPDGSLLVLATGGQAAPNQVQLWDTSGMLLKTLEAHVFAPVSLAISPDGKTLASAGSEVALWRTFTPPAATGEPATIQPQETAESPPEPVTSVKRIAFHTGDFQAGTNDWEIAVINADGTGFAILTRNKGIVNANPAWSPDGTKISFESERDGNYEIYVMNPDGSEQTRLTSNRSSDRQPIWSEDGLQIIFYSDRDGELKTYAMNTDGSNQILAPEDKVDFTQTLSPDRSKFLFHQSENDNLEIFVSDANGDNQRQLTDNKISDFWPNWSADGSKIYFISNHDGFNQLYVMNIDGSEVRNLSNTFGSIQEYQLSPDKAQIAFNSDDQIFVINSDGSGLIDLGVVGLALAWSPQKDSLEQGNTYHSSQDNDADPTPLPSETATLTQSPLSGEGLTQLTFGDTRYYTPDLADDQESMIVSGEVSGHWQLVMVDPNGGGVVSQITSQAADFYHPKLSADNQQILVSSNLDGDLDIYLIDPDSGAVSQQLTNTPGDEIYPVWLPDQSGYLFTSSRDGNEEVYLAKMNGSLEKRLTNSPSFDGFASISPDGQYVAFQSNRDNNYEIYLLDIESEQLTRLTTDPGRDADPVFSPGGEWIAFESDRDGNNEVYAMRVDGSDLQNLTNDPHGDWVPSFSPDGLWLLFQSNRQSLMDIYRLPWSLAP